jgi:hypothetical protein
MVHHIPITKARINLGQLVRRAHLNKECFILEKDKIPVAGIIDVDELDDYLELKDPNIREQIREGYKAYQQGDVKDADTLLVELKSEEGKG